MCFTDVVYLLCTLILSMIIIIIVIMVTIKTQYSKFHFKICFNRVIGFLKKSFSLNKGLQPKCNYNNIITIIIIIIIIMIIMYLSKCTLVFLGKVCSDSMYFSPQHNLTSDDQSFEVYGHFIFHVLY
jgi:Cu/Ag efflux pump CusA